LNSALVQNSTFTPHRTTATLMPDLWSPTDENEACGIKNPDLARLVGLDYAGV